MAVEGVLASTSTRRMQICNVRRSTVLKAWLLVALVCHRRRLES